MKILVAENDSAGLAMLETLLRSEGHEVLAACDGDGAMLAMRHNPDLVILSAGLPASGGYACCREIKQIERDCHVPVVLLLPPRDSAAWASFFESGADDYIEYPLELPSLKAKIRVLLRLNELYQRLARSHRLAEQEIRLAKHMFNSITRRQPEEIDFLHFWSLAAGHFCGDLFIIERTPDQRLHVLLGDFTGHGLAAAVGALPASDVFFAMTRKGFGIEEIAAEINRKLYELLPTGQFCAAVLLCLHPDGGRVEVWNGGSPAVLLVDRQYKIAGSAGARHLPLGIVDPAEFGRDAETLELEGMRSIVLFSDGLIEAQNSLGEHFGADRLARAVCRKIREGCVFNRVKSSVLSFLEGLEPHDDVSLAVINLD